MKSRRKRVLSLALFLAIMCSLFGCADASVLPSMAGDEFGEGAVGT